MLMRAALDTLFLREKKQRAEITEKACKEKKDSSIADDDVENRDELAEQSDKNNVSGPGMKRYAYKKSVIS